MYMATIPIATARANLSQLVDEASSTHERVEITKNGVRAAVLIGAEDYDSIIETIAVLSDTELLGDHLRGLEEARSEDVVNAETLAKLVRDTGPKRGKG
jgi:antitoxin YefM